MGVKPVYKLTTASGKTLKTTLNHPYLTKAGWRKLKDIKAGEEIRAAKELLSAPVGVFSGVHAVNDDIRALHIKADTVFAHPESVGSWWEIDQRFGKMQRVLRREVEFNLFNDAFLQRDREFIEFSLARRGKFYLLDHLLYQDRPSWCLIFSKGTRPNFCASSMPFLSFKTNLGLMGRRDSMASISQPTGLWNTYSLDEADSSNLVSKAQSKSHNEYVSNIKYLGEPFLSTITPALKSLEKARPDFFTSRGIEANFLMDSTLTTSLSNALVNVRDFILLAPYNLKYNISTLNLSRLFSLPKAEAAQIQENSIGPDILWDKIVSIEPLGQMQVYDIEVEGTHNFVAEGIIAHNTYVGDKPFASSSMKEQTTSSPMTRETEEPAKNPAGIGPSLSPSSIPAKSDKGGIDLRALPIVTQRIASPLSGTVPLKRSEIALAGTVPVADLDKEWQEIERLLNAGIIPSIDRLKECLSIACQRQDLFVENIQKVLISVAKMLILQENYSRPTDTSLRELLLLLESDKSAQEFQLALGR